MTQLFLADRILDLGLAVLDTECNALYICSSRPTTYAEATTTFALGNKAFAAGGLFATPQNGTPSGRETVSLAISGGTVTASGTANWWAAVDSVNSRLLATDQLSPALTVTTGQQWVLGSFAIRQFGDIVFGSRVLDNGLNVLSTEANSFCLCTQQPTTYSQATTLVSSGGFKLAQYSSFSGGTAFNAPVDDARGRKAVFKPIVSGATVTETGTATAWAVVDTTNSRLLATGGITSVALAAAQAFTVNAFEVVSEDSQPLSGYDDGFTTAPPGTAQYPNLLLTNNSAQQTFGRTYVTRPPWKVAGVDYHVGIDRNLYPSNANLKDPWPGYPTNAQSALHASLQNVGLTMNPATFLIVLPDSFTLDGFDFSLHNGLRLQPGNSCTISNCYFKAGSNIYNTANLTGLLTSDAGVITITKCEFDGDGLNHATAQQAGGDIQSRSGLIRLDDNGGGHGTKTMSYCVLRDAPGYGMRLFFWNQSPGNNWLFKWNIFVNAGGLGFGNGSGLIGTIGAIESGPTTEGSAAATIDSMDRSFNLFLHHLNMNTATAAGGTPRTDGFLPAVHGRIVDRRLQNNVIIVCNNANVSIFERIDPTRLVSGASLTANYIELSGANGSQLLDWAGRSGTPGPYSGTLSMSGNLDLLTGGLYSALAPAIAATNFNLVLPVSNGQTVGSVTATNSPASFAITAGNASGFFAISSTGVITITAAGASGITAQTYNLTVSATNQQGSGSGAVSVAVSATSGLADGLAGAPAGTPQFPNLLVVGNASVQTYGRNYAARPNWNVAGVDYHVGIDRNAWPTNASLRDPWPGYPSTAQTALHTSLQNQGITLDTNGGTLQLPAGFVFEGYDCSGHNGVRVVPGEGCTIKNCFFRPGSNQWNTFNIFGHAIGSFLNNVTITQNEIDGDGKNHATTQQVGKAMVMLDDNGGHGTKTFTYNYLRDCASLGFHIGFQTPEGGTGNNWVMKYNVLHNPGGVGQDGSTGIHGDICQNQCNNNTDGPSSPAITLADRSFNLILFDLNVTVTLPSGSRPNCGLGFTAESNGHHVVRDFKNNVCIAVNNSSINGFEYIDNTRLSGSATIADNWIDFTSAATAFLLSVGNQSGNPGPYGGTITKTNNKILTTGATFTP